MKKRIIAMMLCIVMVMTLIPVTVLAQEPQSIDADIPALQDCIKINGIVTENIYTDLDYPKMIDTSEENFIEIAITEAFYTTDPNFLPDNSGQYNTMHFLVGTTDAADYLGLSVIAYVKPINENYEIISIAPDAEKNEILEIYPTQFNRINDQGEFEYFPSTDDINPAAVNVENADIIFNNDGGYWLDEIFGDVVADGGTTLNSGKITLINNDAVNGYDVIFVEIAETAVVDEAEEGYVAFKEATSVTGLMDLVIDEDDENVVISITKDGEEISADDLVEWDVLSIITNGDESYIKAEVISNAVIGTIKSVSKSDTSATGFAYTVDGTKYDVAAGAYGQEDLADGEGGTFYIDKYGKIVAFYEDPNKLHHFSLDFYEINSNWWFDIYSDKIKETSNAYVAIYDEDHRMLYASSDVIVADDLTSIYIPKDNNAAYAKIFILKTDVTPAAISEQIDFE